MGEVTKVSNSSDIHAFLQLYKCVVWVGAATHILWNSSLSEYCYMHIPNTTPLPQSHPPHHSFHHVSRYIPRTRSYAVCLLAAAVVFRSTSLFPHSIPPTHPHLHAAMANHRPDSSTLSTTHGNAEPIVHPSISSVLRISPV